jgi:hypothetical protein
VSSWVRIHSLNSTKSKLRLLLTVAEALFRRINLKTIYYMTNQLIDTILELSAAFNCSDGSDTADLINQAKELQLAWLNKTAKSQQEYNALFELLCTLPDDSQIKKILITA